jgi:hypothetical protein
MNKLGNRLHYAFLQNETNSLRSSSCEDDFRGKRPSSPLAHTVLPASGVPRFLLPASSPGGLRSTAASVDALPAPPHWALSLSSSPWSVERGRVSFQRHALFEGRKISFSCLIKLFIFQLYKMTQKDPTYPLPSFPVLVTSCKNFKCWLIDKTSNCCCNLDVKCSPKRHIY